MADAGAVLRDINAALRAAVLEDAPPERLFQVCCEALAAAGLPLARAYVGFRALHPLFQAKSFVWAGEGRPAEDRHALGAESAGSPFRLSPQFHLLAHGEAALRRRLRGPHARLDFPLLEELAARGLSDYRAFVARFGRGTDEGVVGSWALGGTGAGTRAAPRFFSAGELALLEEVEGQLAVLMKAAIKAEIARALVDTYLGGDAGRRVLAGSIKRGDAEEIEAVIWYADLRGSSGHAERLGPAGYLALLDQYFEAVAGPVAEAGGQILLLIGDAVLAIFPIEDGDPAPACRAALIAADVVRERLAATNAERPGEPPLACGLGLHLGRFLFGNIGVPDRLQFTAVGPAVNLAARLEDLCKTLDEGLLASGAFAESLPEIAWRDLGEHALRGLGGSHRVLAPPERCTLRGGLAPGAA